MKRTILACLFLGLAMPAAADESHACVRIGKATRAEFERAGRVSGPPRVASTARYLAESIAAGSMDRGAAGAMLQIFATGYCFGVADAAQAPRS